MGAQFDHHAIHVTNLDVSAIFYKAIFGLEKIEEPFHDGQHVWYRIGDHSQLHLVGGATQVLKQDFDVHIAFRVQSVTDFVNQLNQVGIKFCNAQGEEGKITIRNSDGVKQIYFQDPDGYWLEVNDDKF